MMAPQIAKKKKIDSEVLFRLLPILKKKIACVISYQTPHAKAPQGRTIYPYCILEHNYGLYVLAYLGDKKQVSALAIERIVSIREMREKLNQPEITDYRTYLLQSFDLFMSSDVVRVKIWFDEQKAPLCARTNLVRKPSNQ